MPRRAFGWIAVLGIGLSGVAVTWSQSPRAESPRLEAWRLAPGVPKGKWYPQGRSSLHNVATTARFSRAVARPLCSRRVSARDLLDESFHYNPQAAARLCEPLTPGKGAVPLDVAQAEWAKAEPKPSALTPAFPDGARLAGVFWNALRRPTDSRNGKIVQMAIRSGDEARTRKIRITLPQPIAAEVPSCGPPRDQGEPGAADAVDVSLEEFFWIGLKPGERYNGAACGDFAVLMAFHLVHKVRGKWLWTTFWWDPQSKEFGRDRPSDFRGAGDNPRAWRNYAMDASFDPPERSSIPGGSKNAETTARAATAKSRYTRARHPMPGSRLTR